MEQNKSTSKVGICAVSYLNSVPLVWGLLHDPRYKDQYDLSFRVPSGTAEALKRGEADVGIISSIELPRQNLDFVKSLGIASRGAVRSIFLITPKPIHEIRTLAADNSSRTSVVLCQVVLSRRYNVRPEIVDMSPDLRSMLEAADAALIIGDPALRMEPRSLPYHVYDLGEEWTNMTGLPMVYAVWAAHKQTITMSLNDALLDSYKYGRNHIEDIVQTQSEQRRFPEDLVRQYLTHYINYELGEDHLKGLEVYLQYARELDLI